MSPGLWAVIGSVGAVIFDAAFLRERGLTRIAWNRLYRRTRAFVMRPDGEPIGAEQLALILPTGPSENNIIHVEPWARVEVERFNVRFVGSKTTSRNRAEATPIRVEHILVYDRGGTVCVRGGRRRDPYGGMTFVPHTPVRLARDDGLRVHLQLNAEHEWDGYLSFEANIGRSYRYYGRRVARFRDGA